MCKFLLIILYIIMSLAMFLLVWRLCRSKDSNMLVTLEYGEKLLKPQNLAARLCTASSL